MAYTMNELYLALDNAEKAGDEQAMRDISMLIGARRAAVKATERHINIPERTPVKDALVEVRNMFVTAGAKVAESVRDVTPGLRQLETTFDIERGAIQEKDYDIEKALPDEYKPHTAVGQIGADVLASIPGGMAGSGIVKPLVNRVSNAWGKKLIDYSASSIGSQITSNKDVSAETTLLDTGFGFGLAALGKYGGGTAMRWASGRGRPGEGAVMDAAARVGVTPSRAMLTNSEFDQTAENVLANTFLGSGVIKEFNDANKKALNEFADKLYGNLGGKSVNDPALLGQELKDAFDKFTSSSSEAGEKYFGEAIKRAGGYRIKLTMARQEIAKAGRVLMENPGLKNTLGGGDYTRLAADIEAQAQQGLTLQGAIKLKTAISNVMDNPGAGISTADDNALRALRAALDDDIINALSKGKAPFGTLGAYQEANRVWGEFRDHLAPLRQIFAGQADDIYRSFFGAASGGLSISPSRLKNLLLIMPDNMANQIRAEILMRSWRQAAGQTEKDAGRFSVAQFMTNWTKLKDEGLADILTSTHKQQIDDLLILSDKMKGIGRKVNNSNTANHMTVKELIGGGLIRLSSLGTLPVQYLTARFITSPRAANMLYRIAVDWSNSGGLSSESIKWLMILAQDEAEHGEDEEAKN